MDQDIKAKWLVALRSGEYRQARFQLRTNDDGYCCMGVLADICGAEWKQIGTSGTKAWAAKIPGFETDYSSYLSVPVGLAGITVSQQFELTSQNDDGKKFAEIADWAEVNL